MAGLLNNTRDIHIGTSIKRGNDNALRAKKDGAAIYLRPGNEAKLNDGAARIEWNHPRSFTTICWYLIEMGRRERRRFWLGWPATTVLALQDFQRDA